MICDRSFEEDGSFRYPALDARLAQIPGVSDEYSSGVLGDVILVDGAPWPCLKSTPPATGCAFSTPPTPAATSLPSTPRRPRPGGQ
jgi:hypothetical protein